MLDRSGNPSLHQFLCSAEGRFFVPAYVSVAAVRSGALSLQEACRRYNLSVEEFLAWQRSIDRYGVPGLRVTRLQIYRDTDALRAAK